MTEADGGGPDAYDDEIMSTDDDTLKGGSSEADNTHVFDGIGGKPRMTWSSVTDAGGATRPPSESSDDDRSSFRFDLGGALARLGGDEPPVASTPEPTDAPAARHDPAPPEPVPAWSTEPVERDDASLRPLSTPFVDTTSQSAPTDDEPLIDLGRLDRDHESSAPPVSPAAPAEAPTAMEPDYPRRVPGAHLDPRHRLDHDNAPSPVEAANVDAMPQIREATPVDEAPRRVAPRTSVFGDAEPPLSGVAGAPDLPGVPGVPTASAAMPTLPASNPAAPPPVAEPVSEIGTATDINGLRSAQLKASRQQRQGKLFGRSLLAFVVVGGLIAAAMVFGRSLLFDTAWDGQLTPIVNQVEADRRAAFDRTVPLRTVGSAEFGDRLRTVTIGSDWLDRVPEWRALNLAVGEVTADTIADELARERSAFYDAVSDEIVLVEGASDARIDLRLALDEAFEAQPGTRTPTIELVESGFVGLTPSASIAQEAVDRYLADPVADRPSANESLPIPISYELAAVNALGEALLVAGDLDQAALSPSSPDIDGIGSLLGDAPANSTSGLLQPGDRAIGDPVALGTDDWSLVWATRLPETTVERLVGQVIADSYRTVDRDGTTCVIGVFQSGSAADADSVFASMLIWAAAAPDAAQTASTRVGPTQVQIEACDPGVASGAAGNPGVVDGLVDRQIQRLTN